MQTEFFKTCGSVVAGHKDFAEEYHKILCLEYPAFLKKYEALSVLQRLRGIGLLCGTDWTPLFKNSFFYSRFDHSVGTALIVWNFTHDKKQTVAALLHDVSTPAFSHVTDFRNGDALTQESTESLNAAMIHDDKDLAAVLEQDGLTAADVDDYHRFSVADNKMPSLSADRLEYMYPSGAALDESWTLEEIKKNYSAVKILYDKNGIAELGFSDLHEAVLYTKRFCSISLILQHNEDKVAMQLMADLVSCAVENSIVCEKDLYTFSERELMQIFCDYAKKNPSGTFAKYFFTFTSMTQIEHRETEPSVNEDFYCVNVNVKKRYVDPLVELNGVRSCARVSELNADADCCINAFLNYRDTEFGCVRWASCR